MKSTPKPVHQTKPVPHPGVPEAVHPSGAEIAVACYPLGKGEVTIGAFDDTHAQPLLPTRSPWSRAEHMFRKLVRNKKAIDTIMATLLMVVIVVAASAMVFVYATGLFGALMRAPNFQKEALSLEFSNFGPVNPTYNVTLYLRNTGTVPITLTSYYVKDASGNQYAKNPWTGLSITPTALGQPQILISACGCNNTGTSFTYQTGYSYTITMLSSRGSQFQFSVVRYS